MPLYTQAIGLVGHRDAALPSSQLNPGQVWPSFARHLGRDTFREPDEMDSSILETPQDRALLDTSRHDARYQFALEEVMWLLPIMTTKKDSVGYAGPMDVVQKIMREQHLNPSWGLKCTKRCYLLSNKYG